MPKPCLLLYSLPASSGLCQPVYIYIYIYIYIYSVDGRITGEFERISNAAIMSLRMNYTEILWEILTYLLTYLLT
jgi:hypothetical protein